MKQRYGISFFTPTSKTYPVIPQVKIVKKFTEELDMYEFTLASIEEELDLDFEKYNGLIPIYFKINGKVEYYMYLSYYNCIVTSYNPIKYKYFIQAASPTIQLQRIVLPNKLITQSLGGTKKTIYSELVKIMEVYAPTINLDPFLIDYLNMACPEMQFVKSTLHEVLIGLFAVAGLIPKMNEFDVLSFIDLRGKQTTFDLEVFNKIEKSNSLQNYADALDMDIENAISKEEDIETRWLTPTSDEAVVTDENFYWEMPSEIYEIKRVILSGNNIDFKTDVSSEWVSLKGETLDIGTSVVSKEVYDTLKASSSVVQLGQEYKRNNLFYEGNRIDGATFVESSWLPGTFKTALTNVVLNTLNEQLPSGVTAVRINGFRKTLMKVVYKTKSENTRLKVLRKNIIYPSNSLIGNQDDAFIDIINFGKQKQELINRMGNVQLTAQSNVNLALSNLESTPDVGDLVNGYIVTEKAMLLKENTVLINYVLAQKYIYLTGYSGLKQLKRFTQIDTNRTLIRNDTFLQNFQFAFKNKELINNDNYIAHMIITGYANGSSEGRTLHYVKTYFADGTHSKSLLVASQNKFIADSIVCKIGFDHNYIAGYATDSDYIKLPIKYTDDNGEFKTISIMFGRGIDRQDWDDYNEVKNYPRAEIYDIDIPTYHTDYLINKDNREVTSITMQFRVVNNETDNIYVYEQFLKHTQITFQQHTTLKVYMAYNKFGIESLEEKYDANSVLPIGTLMQNAKVTFEQNKVTISKVLSDFGGYAIGITDSKGNLLFATNYDKVGAGFNLELYLNRI